MRSRVLLKISVFLISVGFLFTSLVAASDGLSRVREILDRVIFRLEDFERRNTELGKRVRPGPSVVRDEFLCQAKGTHFANRQDLAQLVPDLSRRKSFTEGEEKLVSRLVSGYLTFGQIIKGMLANDGNAGDIQAVDGHGVRLSGYRQAKGYAASELLKVFREYFESLGSVLENGDFCYPKGQT